MARENIISGIIDQTRQQYGGVDTPTISYTGAYNTVILQPNAPEPYIIKIPKGDSTEHALLQVQAEAAALQAINEAETTSPLTVPKTLDVADASCDWPYLVTSYIPGNAEVRSKRSISTMSLQQKKAYQRTACPICTLVWGCSKSWLPRKWSSFP